MDKKKIHDFAVKARRELIESVELKLTQVGITRDGVKEKLPTSTAEIAFYVPNDTEGVSGRDTSRRVSLVQRLQTAAAKDDWHTAYDNLVEEASYTWFNRIIALRFMEVNHYLPSRVAVLSSEEGRAEPDILAHALEIEDDLGGFSDEQRDLIQHAQETQEPAAMDNAYRLLFLKQANALNANLPHLFEKTTDAFQLLFTPSYQNGVIKELVTEVPRDDFDVEKEGQVEIIGWLYQYYNEEPKDVAFKKSKYAASDIPAVTQLFTPDWIVKYLVENSLGRYWIDVLHTRGDQRSEQDIAQSFGWRYFMPAAQQTEDVQQQLLAFNSHLSGKKLQQITFLDPAMGSGHILIYAFDVFMQLYQSEGYSAREAANSIVANNLFGLDIDRRAYQLAYFAVMMKLRQYDRRALNQSIDPQLSDIPQTNILNDDLNELTRAYANQLPQQQAKSFQGTLKEFNRGDVLGSLIKPSLDQEILSELQTSAATEPESAQLSFATTNFNFEEMSRITRVLTILAAQYTIVVTNPPYMGSGKMTPSLSKFVKREYPDSKADLFAVFMELAQKLNVQNGYHALITQHQWMFLSSFEKLRVKLRKNVLINMAHLGTRAFEEIGGEVVQSTAFVMRNASIPSYVGTYERLVNAPSQTAKEDAYLEMVKDPSCKGLYRTNQTNFGKIPGSPIAYWVSNQLINSFEQGGSLGQLAEPRQGMATSDNNRFLRQWSEVSFKNIAFDIRNRDEASQSGYTWFPYSKGGHFRKWFGNNELVVNWKNDGEEVRALATKLYKNDTRTIKNMRYYFRSGLSWSALSSGDISFRYVPHGFLFDTKGPLLFIDDNSNKASYLFLLGLLNSKTSMAFLKILAPTMDYNQGPIRSIPMPKTVPDGQASGVNDAAKLNIKLAKKDWDVTEKSWGFGGHPLITHIAEHNRNWTVEAAFNQWKQEAQDRFDQLKKNEEELNKIFIDLYGLQDELSPEESDKEVSVRKADLGRDIRAFISYFIGVTFGRYSLDTPGLAFAGGDWDASKYTSYQPNADDVIVLTDSDYFGDDRDIMHRFREFLTVTFGKEHLEENITFIAKALGKAGDTAEDQIRSYLFNDFYKNHLTIYQKRPIYWQLDSGRQGGFKALMYLHRYDGDTMAMIRTSYLHTLQAAYEKRVTTLDTFIASETNTRQKNQLIKQRDHTRKQLEELVKYDAQLQHVANMHIAIDLDDGVVVNHQKVQADVKLLTPIK
ncbi:BREX-1 system adenine-specific DNA-methyltransferase PglX [Lactiplantibacillus plantarum]|uniref:BREX-1 system adenine-specific DNA-methyltransferase PglX n=1 Tax=Lactiplantibacillus plantarum TaxID=1590 RepID=UPI002017C216|nr:BREX-1 system adenine-specific DNA-methyltransferase PglX [Lactiplantibacillus plantarum]MCL3857518.1 BREX-1 system adenine-specific DNA-methyltransferase PglX [Lactiplantibacillus plantarum]MCS8588415.1 BREX-1 system adenine-specific DNA-methyltransferase PglX [Lactiplantibacillus plantarum]